MLFFVSSCGGTAPTDSIEPAASRSATPATARPDPGAVATDIDGLLATLESTHPEPFHSIPRDEFVAALEAYEERLPNLDATESVVELMRVVALLSRAGRDGHQFALPLDGHEGPVLPLRVYEFAEGLYVTDAAPPHEELIGSRITAIGGMDIAEVLAAVEPLVPRDGPATVPTFRPVLLLRTEVLAGLHIAAEGPIEIIIEPPGGAETETRLEPIPFGDYVAWAGALGILQLPADARVRYLADPEPLSVAAIGDDTIYIRYRSVVRPDVADARAILDANGVDRLILDLRQNPGGDNTTYGPLFSLVREFAADHPGRVIVLIDRVTFSAAANLATEIEQRTDAVFIGEPMGGGLNFWDDVRFVHLDALPVPMRVGVSTRYWQFADPDDPRLTIEPDVSVPVTADDYFAGRDPVLDLALAAGG